MSIQINGQTDTISAVDNNFSLAGNVSIGGTLTYEDVTSVDAVGLSTFQAGIQLDDSITHLGDTDTKIRFPAADTFSVETGGAERLRITSAGNVGINSTIPRSKLHVANGNSNYNPGNPTGLGAGAVASLESSGDVALQFLSSTSTDNFIYFGDTDSATTGSIQYDHNVNALSFNVNGGTERLRITSDGKVGIGLTNPGALLHLESTAANAARLRIGFDSPRYYDIYRGSTTNSGYLNFYGSQTGFTGYIFDGVDGERLRITSNGDVGIGTATPITASGYANLSLVNSSGAQIELKKTGNNSTHYIWTDGTADLNIGANYSGTTVGDLIIKVGGNNERLRITSAGHLKIPYQPRFSAYEGILQTASGSEYKIEFSSANVNIGGHYSTSNDRFTAPVAGDYYFMYRVMAGAATHLRCQFKVNGSYVLDQFFSENVTYANNVGSMIYTLSVGDEVEVWCDVQNNSQGTIHGGYRCFVGHLLG